MPKYFYKRNRYDNGGNVATRNPQTDYFDTNVNFGFSPMGSVDFNFNPRIGVGPDKPMTMSTLPKTKFTFGPNISGGFGGTSQKSTNVSIKDRSTGEIVPDVGGDDTYSRSYLTTGLRGSFQGPLFGNENLVGGISGEGGMSRSTINRDIYSDKIMGIPANQPNAYQGTETIVNRGNPYGSVEAGLGYYPRRGNVGFKGFGSYGTQYSPSPGFSYGVEGTYHGATLGFKKDNIVGPQITAGLSLPIGAGTRRKYNTGMGDAYDYKKGGKMKYYQGGGIDLSELANLNQEFVESGALQKSLQGAKMNKLGANVSSGMGKAAVITQAADMFVPEKIQENQVYETTRGAVGGAMTGAQLGSMIAPGIGTVIGAIGGALLGGGKEIAGNVKENKLNREMEADRAAKARASTTSGILEFLENQNKAVVTSPIEEPAEDVETKMGLMGMKVNNDGDNMINNMPTDSIYNRQIFTESRYDSDAVSSAGATSIAQIMPSTFEDGLKKGYVPKGTKYEDLATNDALALQFRDNYMADLLSRSWNKGSDKIKMAKALAAYNLGPTALVKILNKSKKTRDIYNNLEWLEDLPKETREYVNKIMVGGDEDFEKEYKKSYKKYVTGGMTKGSYNHKTNPLTVVDKNGQDTGMELTGGEGVYDNKAQNEIEKALKKKDYKKVGKIVEYEINDWKKRGMYS